MTAFLDAQASWIKANLHRQQCDIAGDLLDMIPAGQPRIDLAAMKVALYRWLDKQGWSDKHLRALGVECVLRGANAPALPKTAPLPVSIESPAGRSSELHPAPSIMPANEGAGSLPISRLSEANPTGSLANEVHRATPRKVPLSAPAGPAPAPTTGRYMSASFFAPAKPKGDTP